MPTRLLLASLGVAAVVVPAPAASATCIVIEGVGCINPSCEVAKVGNTVLDALGSDEGLHCTR